MGNLQPEAGAESAAAYVPMQDWHSQGAAALARADPAPVRVSRSSTTSQGYTLALLPAVHAFLIISIAVIRSGETTWVIIGATNVAMMLIGVLVARGDQRALGALGLREPTSTWWGLPSPLVYLLFRGNRAYRQTFTGLRPFWLCALVTALSAVTILLAPTIGHFVGRPLPF